MKINQVANFAMWSLIVLVVALLGGQTASGWNFSPQTGPLANQQQQQQQRQQFAGLNQQNFYQPPANQFAPGRHFFENPAFVGSGPSPNGHMSQAPKPQQQHAQFLTPSTASSPVLDQPPVNTYTDMSTRAVGESNGADSIAATFAPTRAPSESDRTALAKIASPWSEQTDSTSRIQINADQLALDSGMPPSAKRQTLDETHEQADHEVVAHATPSPMGKIFDSSVRGDSTQQVSANKHTAATTATPTTTTSTTTTTTTSTTQRPAQSGSADSPKRQVLKPARGDINKDPLKRVEMQIIDQHARASLVHGRLGEHHQEPTTTTTASTPAQHFRLLPANNGAKLVNSFLSLLNYNSQTATGANGPDSAGAAESSSPSKLSSSPYNDDNSARQPSQKANAGLLGSLMDNFKTGISSRASIIKAQVGDNKLARTFTTVSKTIGGNKYVAGAGIAAALAALGLTVGKLVSPYVMAGNYQKLGGVGFDHLSPASSGLQPTYYDPLRGGYSYGGQLDQLTGLTTTNTEPFLASAASGAPGLYEPLEPSNPYNQQQLASGPAMTTANPMAEATNGHYSSFYASQPAQPMPTGDNYAQPSQHAVSYAATSYAPQPMPGQYQLVQPQRYGSYVSGVPSHSTPYQQSQAVAAMAAADAANLVFSSQEQPQTNFEPTLGGPDQIMSAASASDMVAALSGQAQASQQRVASNQRRLGAVSLNLDEHERELLRQQLRAESKRARPHYSSANAFVGADGDQSAPTMLNSNSIGQMDPVRRKWLASSSPPATISTKFHLNGPTATAHGVTSAVSGQEGQARLTKQQTALQSQFVVREPQTMSADDHRVSPIRASMQTSRNKMDSNNNNNINYSSNKLPAYLMIAANSSQTQWQASGQPASRLSTMDKAERWPKPQQQLRASSMSSGWQALESPTTEKSPPPLRANESDSLAATDEVELDNETPNGEPGEPADKVAPSGGSEGIRLNRFSRTTPSTGATSDARPLELRLLSLKDYDDEPRPSGGAAATKSRYFDNENAADPPAKMAAAVAVATIGKQQQATVSLMAHSSASTNAIQANRFGAAAAAAAAADGSKYQIDAATGEPDGKATMANKLIEATTGSMANNAAPSIQAETTVAQHDDDDHHNRRHNHQYHNHRAQPAPSDSDNVVVDLLPGSATAEKRHLDNGNADNVNGAGQQKDNDDNEGGQPRAVDDTGPTGDKRRSFHGIVAGSIGAS